MQEISVGHPKGIVSKSSIISMFLYMCSYTWKIYANKVINMGSTYSYWRHLNKDQKLAKQRYIHSFYNLQYRSLVK